jgi:hypothetical protein
LDDIFKHAFLNDIAFCVDDDILIVCEHQSTINSNMPLRILFYSSRIMEQYINDKYGKDALLNEKLKNIPRIQCIVLYNGVKKLSERDDLRLSDAYLGRNFGDRLGTIEVTVPVYNVNLNTPKGVFGGLSRKSIFLKDGGALYEYVKLMGTIRGYREAKLDVEIALKKTFDEYRNVSGMMADFIKKYGEELLGMLSQEITLEDIRRASREDGREEGMELLLKELNLSAESDDIKKILDKIRSVKR